MFKFLAISLIPPTVLCIVVAVLHLNALHPPWSAFVLVAQVMSTPVIMQPLLNYVNVRHPNILYRISLISAATIYGSWNLDFFRALYKPTYISPSITAMQSYIIEEAIGLYPLVLLVVLYSFVTLRDRGYRVIVKIWNSFLSCFQSKLNLLLPLFSFSHTNWICCFLCSYPNSSLEPKWLPHIDWLCSYMDPSMPYFGSFHIGYAVFTLLLVCCVDHSCHLAAPLPITYFSSLIAREAMLCLFSYAVVLGLYTTFFVLVQSYKAQFIINL